MEQPGTGAWFIDNVLIHLIKAFDIICADIKDFGIIRGKSQFAGFRQIFGINKLVAVGSIADHRQFPPFIDEFKQDAQ